jgi:ABC-type uncharacterized transport system involved in gliding motility auxiliary subunit
LAAVTITRGSARLLGTLTRPMQVTVYATRGTAKLEPFIGELVDLLRAYERAGRERFRFSLIDPNTTNVQQRAEQAGVTRRLSSDGFDGYFGLVFAYGGQSAVIPALPIDHVTNLEYWITTKVRGLRDVADGIKNRIGVIAKKGELRLDDRDLVPRYGPDTPSPSIISIMRQAFPFYQVEDVDLKGGTEKISTGLLGLIVTQPQQDYTEAELRRLDEFLLRGNSLVVYASAATLKAYDSTLVATLGTHGLEKLLGGYGVRLNRDIVFDYGSHFRVGIVTGDSIEHPALVHATRSTKGLLTSFAPFFEMSELMFPFPSSLTLLPNVQPKDVRAYPVAHSSTQSIVESEDTIDLKLRERWHQPAKPASRYVLAAAVQGKLKSAFSEERSAYHSRLLVVASSLFLTNPFAYAGNPREQGGDETLQLVAAPYSRQHLVDMIVSFKNTLDWVTADEDLVLVGTALGEDVERALPGF